MPSDLTKLIEVLENEQPLTDGSASVGRIMIEGEADEANDMTIVKVPEHRIGFAFHKNTKRLAYIFNYGG